MNVFAVNYDPKQAARDLCDVHVIKMVLETAQLLSTISHLHGIQAPYKLTHKNHPATIWANQTLGNYNWLVEHGLELADEYSRRYGKIHKSREIILWAKEHGGKPSSGNLQPFVQCMGEEFRKPDPVEGYRNYYRLAKAEIAVWKYSPKPSWWNS